MAIWGVRVGSISDQLACRAACILQMLSRVVPIG